MSSATSMMSQNRRKGKSMRRKALDSLEILRDKSGGMTKAEYCVEGEKHSFPLDAWEYDSVNLTILFEYMYEMNLCLNSKSRFKDNGLEMPNPTKLLELQNAPVTQRSHS